MIAFWQSLVGHLGNEIFLGDVADGFVMDRETHEIGRSTKKCIIQFKSWFTCKLKAFQNWVSETLFKIQFWNNLCSMYYGLVLVWVGIFVMDIYLSTQSWWSLNGYTSSFILNSSYFILHQAFYFIFIEFYYSFLFHPFRV